MVKRGPSFWRHLSLKNRKFSTALFFSIGLFALLSFQNCGTGRFEVVDMASTPPPTIASLSIDVGLSVAIMGTEQKPVVTIDQIQAGDQVYLYGDGQCAGLLNSSVSNSNSLQMTASQNLPEGLTEFHVRIQRDSRVSPCSPNYARYILDLTPPTSPTMISDGVAIASTELSPPISWTSSMDLGSGISHYEISLYQRPNTSMNWILTNQNKTSTVPATNFSSFAFVDQRYYAVQIVAVDKVGNRSTPTMSDGWQVDLSLVGGPLSIDDKTFWNRSDRSPVITWTAAPNSDQVDHYEAALGIYAGDTSLTGWVAVGKNLSHQFLGLSLLENNQDGHRYYASVRAVRANSEHSSPTLGDGFLVDMTPPLPPANLKFDDTNSRGIARPTNQSPLFSFQQMSQSSFGSGDNAWDLAVTTSADLTGAQWQDSSSAVYGGQFLISGLNLERGQEYFLSVRTRDEAGNISTPVQISWMVADWMKNVKQLSIRDFMGCLLKKDGSVACYGDNRNGLLGIGSFGPPSQSNDHFFQPVGLSQGVTSIMSKGAIWEAMCAGLNDGTVKCWGQNVVGSLFLNGNIANQSSPQLIPGLSGVQEIDGHQSPCAILQTGKVVCWNGVFGNYSFVAGHPFFGPISNLDNVAKVSVGGNSACALLTNGHVKCWAGNLVTFYPASTVPTVTQSNFNDFIFNAVEVKDIVADQISVGFRYTCLIQSSDKSVKCWGENGSAELGNGNLVTTRDLQTVKGVTGALQIDTMAQHSCALTEAGKVICWGYTAHDLESPDNMAERLEPVEVPHLTGATSIHVTFGGVCGIIGAESRVRCVSLPARGSEFTYEDWLDY